jgi:hypothetical protein
MAEMGTGQKTRDKKKPRNAYYIIFRFETGYHIHGFGYTCLCKSEAGNVTLYTLSTT